jgi:hypothetical protein
LKPQRAIQRFTAAKPINEPASSMEVLAASGESTGGAAITLPVTITIAAISNPYVFDRFIYSF